MFGMNFSKIIVLHRLSFQVDQIVIANGSFDKSAEPDSYCFWDKFWQTELGLTSS